MNRKYGYKIEIDKLKLLLKAILERIKNGEKTAKDYPAIFIWGPPGVGKSSIIKQLGEELNIEVIDLRLSQLDVPDLRGLIYPKGDKAVWLVPEFLPRENKLGILFLDEINLANASVQATAYQLILDRRVGDYKLPDKWLIIGAGNREQDSNIVEDIAPPLLNRFIHFEVDYSFSAWEKWATEKERIKPEIIKFLAGHPNFFANMKFAESSVAFPTPRSWEFANRILVEAEENGQLKQILEKKDDFDKYRLLKSAVGEEATSSLINFIAIYHSFEDVFADFINELFNDKIQVNDDKFKFVKRVLELASGIQELKEKQQELTYKIERENKEYTFIIQEIDIPVGQGTEKKIGIYVKDKSTRIETLSFIFKYKFKDILNDRLGGEDNAELKKQLGYKFYKFFYSKAEYNKLKEEEKKEKRETKIIIEGEVYNAIKSILGYEVEESKLKIYNAINFSVCKGAQKQEIQQLKRVKTRRPKK
ncbi:MAG: MoxR family ATPase [candidate division WOR-3 bacterium]